jgi:hypothetical protein
MIQEIIQAVARHHRNMFLLTMDVIAALKYACIATEKAKVTGVHQNSGHVDLHSIGKAYALLILVKRGKWLTGCR